MASALIQTQPAGMGTGLDQPLDLTEPKLRRWLSLLAQPNRLADPDVIRLLELHERLPPGGSDLSVGHAAADLLREKIEALRPPEDADRYEKLPHLLLTMCFVEGAKLLQVADKLGLSERQLSRHRSRALGLLKSELLAPPTAKPYRPEPIPAIRDFLTRPGPGGRLQRMLETYHAVAVTGPPGMGKTSLVAELATELQRSMSVLWYCCRAEVNSTLPAVLFELGEYLRSLGSAELSDYIASSLPELDSGLATRLALRSLDQGSHLIALDDFHFAEEELGISALIDEITSRLPGVRVITIGRHRPLPTSRWGVLEIDPLTKDETRDLISKLRRGCDQKTIDVLHRWTGGNPHLLKLAVSWLKGARQNELDELTSSFSDTAEVQSFLLSGITELLDSDDRALLEAASVFRDRFSDDALAFVAERTRGEVLDASLRLVRGYVATRSLDGQSAFFHTSVRDYVYDRLTPERRGQLHERAALWFKRAGNRQEAKYHEQRDALSEHLV